MKAYETSTLFRESSCAFVEHDQHATGALRIGRPIGAKKDNEPHPTVVSCSLITAAQHSIITAPAKPAISYDWYRAFIQFMLDNGWYSWFAPLVAGGEFLIGVTLILGAFVGIAAFFGGFLNWNFVMAGAASTNGMLFALAVVLILAWKVAGWYGLDRWLLPLLGTPWNGTREQVPPSRPQANPT